MIYQELVVFISSVINKFWLIDWLIDSCWENKTLCVSSKFFFRWRETNISQVYYVVFESDLEYLFLFLQWEPEENMCDGKLKKPYLSPLLKNGHSRITLELKLRMVKFSGRGRQWFHVRGKAYKHWKLCLNIDLLFQRVLSKYICPSCRNFNFFLVVQTT